MMYPTKGYGFLGSIAIVYYSFIRRKRKAIIYKTVLLYGEISMYLFAIHGFIRFPFIKLAEDYNHPLLKIIWAISFFFLATIAAFVLKWVVNNYLKILNKLSHWANSLHSRSAILFIEGTRSIMQTGLIFIGILAFLRLYEFSIFHFHHEVNLIGFHFLSTVIIIDSLYGIGLLGLLLFPYILLYRFSKLYAKIFISFSINLIIISSITLIQYYDFTSVPLDRVIFAYSWNSILELSKTVEINALSILPYIISLLLFNTLLYFSNRIVFKRLFIILFIPLSLVIAIIHNQIIPKERDYSNEQEYFYANNKLLFFIKDIIRYKPSHELKRLQSGKAIDDYQKVFPERNYLGINYPFLRKPDKGDPIGAFFNKTKNGQKPNIVFIIVESLSTPISGPYAYKASFTPFLDSLTEHSLYWRNNLSTSDRTFGVLPSVLGSLPYGKRGFIDLNIDMPKHKSIINILAKNDYATRFFYGGATEFNNTDVYMNINNIDTIINNFDPKDSIPPNNNGFSWGFSDRAIFQSTFNTIRDSNESYLSIYLTLSTHSPFMIKNPDYYNQKVLNRIKILNISEEEQPAYIKNQQKLATFLFFDNELRNFFNEYRKRKDFKNTIFIITGDHRGIIFTKTSQIDAYHTPLIVYSPLLKKGYEFGGVSSHVDITPTLMNFLKNNYQIEIPKQIIWQGSLLDTSRIFHCQQRMAFMRNNRTIRDYIHGNYYISNSNLYKVHDTLHLEKINNVSIESKLQKELIDYKNLNKLSLAGLQKQAHTNLVQIDSNYFDFEGSIPNFFKSNISNVMAYSGSHSAVMKKDQQYPGLNPSIILDENISRLYIDISFKVFVNEFSSENPIIVFSTSKEGKNLSWNSTDFMNNNFGTDKKWKTIKVSKTLFFNPEDSKGIKLKIYLWNRQNCELYYDDISVSIKAEKQ